MIREPFITNSCYHLLNRGVEKRNIFMNDADRRRFLVSLSMFNTETPIINLSEKLARNEIEVSPRLERLVHIVAYCLMRNHFHILLVQAKDRGIEKFMQKLGTGYTMYFNKRYERVGSLFQGVFKSVPVDTDEHLYYLPHYIHANPLDLNDPGWRENSIENKNIALKTIGDYPWSSYKHYTNKIDDPIIDNDMIVELFSNKKLVVDSMEEWLGNMTAKNNLINSGLTLE